MWSIDLVTLKYTVHFRYLVHLETPGDPAWQCLTNMQQWLVQLLNACKEENIKKGIVEIVFLFKRYSATVQFKNFAVASCDSLA